MMPCDDVSMMITSSTRLNSSFTIFQAKPRILNANFPAGWLPIDLLATLEKSLDRALFLYNFIREVRSSGVRGSITIMHIRKFFKVHHNIVRFRFFSRIAKRSM